MNELDESQYLEIRAQLLSNSGLIEELERKYMNILQEIVADAAPRIFLDFGKASIFLPFWKNYPPKPRGRGPRGTSIPWSEVGETSIGSNILRALVLREPDITFPGLPSGADIRFATEDALIHFDIKVTGPNDKADEIVASPNQVSGDGIRWENGVINSPQIIRGDRASMHFQPELPPFYVVEGDVLICLTYFLKGVYTVENIGYQPLTKLDLICVPNGLLAFDGPKYGDIPGLFIPGKDEKAFAKKRTRVRMEPLSKLAEWRRVTVGKRELPYTPLIDSS